MSKREILQKLQAIQENLLSFLQSDDELEKDLNNFRQYLDKEKIIDKDNGLIEFLILISNISNNHRRTDNIQRRIEKILLSYKKDIKQNLSNSYLYHIFHTNKLLLIFLFEEKIIDLDSNIIFQLNNFPNENANYPSYFLPETLKSSSPNQQTNDFPDNFLYNRKKGENHNYICELIRNDLVSEFVAYVTKTNLSLSSKIEPSIFETHPILYNKITSIIEYACFFGAIQIIKYLHINYVELESDLWTYSIHSNNADLIHFLEEKKVLRKNDCFEVSIKCYHNEITNYFITTDKRKEPHGNITVTSLLSFYNFEYFPSDAFILENLFIQMVKYNYYLLVKQRIDDPCFDINRMYIL